MPISPRDFEKACREFKINWFGTGHDSKPVAQLFFELQQGITEQRVQEMIAAAIPPAMTEDRVKELIAEAILVEQPPVEVPPEQLLLTEGGDPILLTEANQG